MNDDFYVGYLSHAPEGLGRLWKRWSAALVAGCALVALAIAATQEDQGTGTYEFGITRGYRGTVEAAPVPSLIVSGPTGERSRYALVQFGKSGASEIASELDGREVQLEAALVHRGGATMLEVVEGSIETVDTDAPAPPLPRALVGDNVRIEGEVVDSKCFLGAMKPGLGRTHRACAELCLRGGIPALVIGHRIDDEGESIWTQAFLVGPGGDSLSPSILERGLVAEPVAVEGRLEESGGWLFLHTSDERVTRL